MRDKRDMQALTQGTASKVGLDTESSLNMCFPHNIT